jgi:nucleotide-binding universal stress UspA family protein
MKTILVPTDFSPIANNAVHYAAALANYADAKLVLLHIYSIPVPVADVPVDMTEYMDDEEKESMHRLKKLQTEINNKYSKIKTECIVKPGFVTDEVLVEANAKKADLIVMGGIGAGKAPGILGSNTSTVMKRTKLPVLSIPPGMEFSKPKKVALACDYSTIVADEVIKRFKDFVNLFKAEVLVFDVLKKAELVSYEKAAAEVNLENSLGNIKHSLHFPSGDNLVEEVNKFVEANKVAVLVTMPHNYRLIEGLFHGSNAKKLVFNTHVPLLSIHE